MKFLGSSVVAFTFAATVLMWVSQQPISTNIAGGDEPPWLDLMIPEVFCSLNEIY